MYKDKNKDNKKDKIKQDKDGLRMVRLMSSKSSSSNLIVESPIYFTPEGKEEKEERQAVEEAGDHSRGPLPPEDEERS